MRALAAARCYRTGGRFSGGQFSTDEEILEAIAELERIAELADVASLSAALEENGDVPAAVAPPELAEAELAELARGRAGELLEREEPGPDPPEPERLLAEGLQECLEEARAAGLRARADAEGTPPPPVDDGSPHAQAARLPAVTALAEAARDARAGLGASEVRPRAHRREPASLGALLEALEGAVGLAGAGRADIAGVADEAGLVQPGDAVVLPWASADREVLAARLAEAADRGAAAAVLFGAPPEEAADAGAERALAGAAGLQAVAVVADARAPAELARRFFGSPAERLRVVGVCGDDAIAVRTAASLLSSALERQHGAPQTALLSSRRSLIGLDFLDVDRPLTACSVQELLAEAVARGVEWCVAEVLQGGHSAGAFAGIQFTCSVDLSRGGGHSELEQLRAEVLGQTADGCVVQMSGGEPLRSPRPVFFETALPAEETKAFKLARGIKANSDTEQALARELGITPVQKYQSSIDGSLADASKAKMLEQLEELGCDQAELDTLKSKSKGVVLQRLKEVLEENQSSDGPEPEPGILMGQVLLGSKRRAHFMHLRLWAAESPPATLRLPLMGASAARGALGACRAALATGAADAADLERLRLALEDAEPPPGVLEVHTAGSPTSACAVYHEASTPQEVRDALVAVREWLPQRPRGREKLIAVLGCEGEIRRGDRAKYGWALAELCDEVVLTSNHPRGEPAMQIVEDVLEAIKGRARSTVPGIKSRLFPVCDVHVVADRVDAIKLAVCSSATRDPERIPPSVAVIFGSSTSGDFQEAPDAHGRVRRWMCNDRRVLLEALECAEKLSRPESPFTIGHLPWHVNTRGESPRSRRTLASAPKESLHWTYWVDAGTKGELDRRL